MFTNNAADFLGGVISSYGKISFVGNSSPVFSNNTADNNTADNNIAYNNIAERSRGGAIYSIGTIIFKENTFPGPVFTNNLAYEGGAVFSDIDGDVSF